MIIHLLRHGMTEANERRLYCGSTDMPLSRRGLAELLLLKKEGIYPTCKKYVTGTLMRAIETLDVLYGQSPDLTMAEFNEYDFGAFEMKSHDELATNPDYLRWIQGDENVFCPRGESKKTFADRISSGFTRLCRLETESVLLVCHGGVIASLMEMLFPNQKRHYFEWLPLHGRGYTIDKADKLPVYKPL